MADLVGLVLDADGLAAIAAVMFAKGIGVPIPVPADVLMLATAVRVAEGKLALWQAFAGILMAMALGSLVQFALAGGPGRGLLYRFGRYLGLTPARLDAAAARARQGGAVGVALAILLPGVRAAAVPACGLAGLPIRTFVPGLLLGDSLFLGFHLSLGYFGASLVLSLLALAPAWALVLALLVVGLGVWVVIRRRQRPEASRAEVVAEAFAAWHDASCPACLVAGALASQRAPRV